MARSFLSKLTACAAAVALAVPLVTACGASESDALVIYSGRNEGLVKPILDKLQAATGTKVEVRYGGSAEFASQLLEEGDNTDADLFFSQDAGALGALAQAGMLEKLPQDVLDLVPAGFHAKDGTWVATSARARVIAFDPKQVKEAELPATLDEVVDPKWKGKIGYAPTNGSWQAFVTSIRVLKGDDYARQWLAKFRANEPQRFENNIAILGAVNAGQVPLGLINHYYYFEKVAEEGAQNVRAKIHFARGADSLSLLNVAGVGVLENSNKADAARKAAAFLLSEEAQRYFADGTAEYPVVEGVASTEHDLPPLSSLKGPDIDLSQLSSLEETLKLLQEAGLS